MANPKPPHDLMAMEEQMICAGLVAAQRLVAIFACALVEAPSVAGLW